MKNIIALTFLILIVGCAPPALVKKEAESVLTGDCLKMFSCGMPHCYNYGNVGDKPITAFAIAFSKDKRQQVCSTLKTHEYGHNPQDLVIQRCELMKLKTHIFPKDWDKCEIYAIGWNIVYKKKTDVELKKPEVVKPTPISEKITPKVSIDDAKKQCSDIGFKAGTEKFGECVLKLNR